MKISRLKLSESKKKPLSEEEVESEIAKSLEVTGDDTPEETTDDVYDADAEATEQDDVEQSDESSEDPVEEEPIEEPTTVYKVTYTLGDHTNWSRFEATTEDEAKDAVETFIKKKYPNREYEFVEIEEYNEEEETNESLTEDVEDVPVETQRGPSDGAEYGLSALINDAIQGELKTVDEYNSLAISARDEGYEDIANVVDEICTEENKHIGQLEELLKLISPNANAIDDGKAEGEEQLSNPSANDVLGEDLEDMNDSEYELFKDAVDKFYGITPLEFMRKYFSGNGVDIIDVDEFDNLPDNTIELNSTDLSQGTGNVIVYEVFSLDDGKIYRYTSY